MKVYIATFGCRANQYDSEAAKAMLVAGGAEIVESPETADAALFNSCAVTSRAEADLRASIRRAARANPALRTVVMGCAAALDPGRDAARSLRSLPTVDGVVPGADLEGVARSLGVDPALALARPSRQSGARALLRIQDGCDEHCTFCATTLARGVNSSRPVGEVVAEAERLAEWHSEIVITGVHIGSYGADDGTSLALLVERLVRAVPSARFRLSSVEATEVDDRLRELGERKADAYHRARDGGEADVVIVGSAAKREGLTGDYIRVRCGDQSLARGTRVKARLEYRDGEMLATAARGRLRDRPQKASAGG